MTFSVVASGSDPLSYQWRLNSVDIPGATGASYTISSVQPAQAGDYTVVVSNAGGTVTSATALLTVNVPPSITSQPQSQVATAGISVTCSVGANGTAPFSYQWYCNNSSIAGASGASYTISAAQAGDAGDYKVRVSNSAGIVDSVVATLAVALTGAATFTRACSPPGPPTGHGSRSPATAGYGRCALTARVRASSSGMRSCRPGSRAAS